MVKIIETNISLNDDDKIVDFQSRVIEVDSWDSFVNEMKEGRSIHRTSCLGSLIGESYPRFGTDIKDIKCDDHHLSFYFKNGVGRKMCKLAYLIS